MEQPEPPMQKALNKQRRKLRRRTIMLVFFQMAAVGAIMFTGRFFASKVDAMAWIEVYLPMVAQISVLAIWFFGVLWAFRRETA